MILLQKQDHGCVYTLDIDSKELYYAPIYNDNTVNLSEFTPVELDAADNTVEILNIQKELISLNK